MESDRRLPTGEWNGFFLENHQDQRGWMHLYLTFAEKKIKGEGTDYVGPWHANGEYDLSTGICSWVKSYLGKHPVTYQGTISENGIMGRWQISFLSGEFHIWPKAMSHLTELYMADDLANNSPTILLGTETGEPWNGENVSFL